MSTCRSGVNVIWAHYGTRPRYAKFVYLSMCTWKKQFPEDNIILYVDELKSFNSVEKELRYGFVPWDEVRVLENKDIIYWDSFRFHAMTLQTGPWMYVDSDTILFEKSRNVLRTIRHRILHDSRCFGAYYPAKVGSGSDPSRYIEMKIEKEVSELWNHLGYPTGREMHISNTGFCYGTSLSGYLVGTDVLKGAKYCRSKFDDGSWDRKKTLYMVETVSGTIPHEVCKKHNLEYIKIPEFSGIINSYMLHTCRNSHGISSQRSLDELTEILFSKGSLEYPDTLTANFIATSENNRESLTPTAIVMESETDSAVWAITSDNELPELYESVITFHKFNRNVNTVLYVSKKSYSKLQSDGKMNLFNEIHVIPPEKRKYSPMMVAYQHETSRICFIDYRTRFTKKLPEYLGIGQILRDNKLGIGVIEIPIHIQNEWLKQYFEGRSFDTQTAKNILSNILSSLKGEVAENSCKMEEGKCSDNSKCSNNSKRILV